MTDNELIAEFMGLDAYVSPENILYHKSWDWLMPVVEKIDSLPETSFEMYPAYAGIGSRIGVGVKISTQRKDFDILVLPNGRTRIEVAHKAVVSFIKWYNENK